MCCENPKTMKNGILKMKKRGGKMAGEGSGHVGIIAVRAKPPLEITAARAILLKALQRAAERTKPGPERNMNGQKNAEPPHELARVWPDGLGM
jgi:hypothetical protein